MKQTVFYQSSMPRAGSTLLQNIVGQNPLFHVTPTSSMIDLMLGARLSYNQSENAKSSNPKFWKESFYSFCREGFKGYTANLTDKPYILDKNRTWGCNYSLLKDLLGEPPKVVFMVRDLRSILSSMEKKFRQNPDIIDPMVNSTNMLNVTTIQRIETWSNGHPVGYSLKNLYQSLLDKTADNFLFIKYEELCTNPDKTFKDLYDFLELDQFQHDYKHIPQITVENDAAHGVYGDHTIRNTLEALPDDSKEVLGYTAYKWVSDNFEWYFDNFGYKI
mgnify:CR=1 FL=1